MKLYLIQHARAKTEEEDPERGLTEEGISEAQMCFAFFSRQKPKPQVIWHSGKKRALQTAEILKDRLGYQGPVSEHPSLSPNDDVKLIAKELERGERDTAVVGHMPHLDKLASFLLTGDENGGVISFRNSGVVCLERQEFAWRISWMANPELAL